MADTTIRLEFRDDTPPQQQSPSPGQIPNYLTGNVQPTAQPAVVPPVDVITPQIYKSYTENERKLADRLIAEGQLHVSEAMPAGKEMGRQEMTPAQSEKEAAKGEKEAREQERQDRLARKIGKGIIDAEYAAIPLATSAEPTEADRKRGEKEAREKEAQDARDRTHVLKHLKETIPEALPVEESKPEPSMLERFEPILRQMGFGGVSKLAGKFFGGGGAGGEAAAGAEGGAAAEGIGIGTIGLAVAAVAKVLQVGADTLRIGMKAHSDTVVELAGNNYMGAFNKQVEGAADTMRQIPIVGGALASGLELAVQPVRSFTDVVSSFVERGKELSKYNGPLAAANAQADVRAIMSDIREANELGPELAQLTDAQSQIWAELREITLPMKKALLDVLVPLMQEMLLVLRATHAVTDAAGTAAIAGAAAGAQSSGLLGAVAAGLVGGLGTLNSILGALEKPKDDPGIGDWSEWFDKDAFRGREALPMPALPNPVLPHL